MNRFASTLRAALAPSTDLPPLTLERAVGSLIRGAVAGAATISLGIAAMAMAGGGVETIPSLVMIALVAFPVAMAVWLVGLVLIGSPGWFLLHRLRWRSLPVALLYGAGMGFMTGLIIALVSQQSGLAPAGFLAVAGIGAGGVVWMHAYGRGPA